MLLLACYETRWCECCCWHRSISVCWPAKAAAWHLPLIYSHACAAVDIHSLSRPPVIPPSLPQLHPDASKLNISHTIHELRFGPRFPGQVSRGFLLRFAALLGVLLRFAALHAALGTGEPQCFASRASCVCVITSTTVKR